MTEPITTPSGWKKYDPPIPFHEWKGCIMGMVLPGKIVHYRLIWKLPDGTTLSKDKINLIGDANSNGIISYESEGIKFWEFPILDAHGEKIYPECYIIAETDALIPIFDQFRKEAENLTVLGLTQQRFLKIWDGVGIKFVILETRNENGELLIPSRIIKEFSVDISNPLSYLQAEQEADSYLIRLSTGEITS